MFPGGDETFPRMRMNKKVASVPFPVPRRMSGLGNDTSTVVMKRAGRGMTCSPDVVKRGRTGNEADRATRVPFPGRNGLS